MTRKFGKTCLGSETAEMLGYTSRTRNWPKRLATENASCGTVPDARFLQLFVMKTQKRINTETAEKSRSCSQFRYRRPPFKQTTAQDPELPVTLPITNLLINTKRKNVMRKFAIEETEASLWIKPAKRCR